MTSFETLKHAADSTVITRANVDSMLDSGRIEVAMKNGNWWQIRRNGKTRTWKKDSKRVAIPFKAGMYAYGTITETDFDSAGILDASNYRFRLP